MARSLFAALCLSAAAAFAPIARPALRATTSAAMVPEAAQALDVVSQLPTQLVSLEVRGAVPFRPPPAVYDIGFP